MALFLFGVKFMGEGFESLVRNRLKTNFDGKKVSPLNYIVIGFIVTLLVQFSAVTTIMTVGLANSGIVSLIQALGIIMGANLATTIKTTIYMYNPLFLVPLISILGTVFYVFSSAKRYRDLSKIFIGISIAVISLSNVSNLVKSLKDSLVFLDFLRAYGSSFLILFLAGIIFTIIFQSSSATMAIIIALVGQGLLSLDQAFMVIAGANIGTTSTTLISAIGGGKDGKRAAFMHLLFNILGAILLLPFSGLLIKLTNYLGQSNLSFQASLLHVLFNLITLIILIPFMKLVVEFTKFIIPDKEYIIGMEKSKLLDKRIINTPAFAEQQVLNQTLRLAELAKDNVRLVMDSFINDDVSREEEIRKNEDLINYLEINLMDFLVKLTAKELDEKNQGRFSAIHTIVDDLERIGDITLSMFNLTIEKVNKKAEISEEAKKEIKAMYSYLMESLNIAYDSLRNNDKNMASTNVDIERHLNEMHSLYRQNHIKRLNRGKCSPLSGILFLDFISYIENIGNISAAIIESFIKDVAV